MIMLSGQGDQLGTTGGGRNPGVGMGRRQGLSWVRKVRKDLGQCTRPRGKGGHSKGFCAMPWSSAASQINPQCLWGQTRVQIPILPFPCCVALSTFLNLSERNIFLYKMKMMVPTSLSDYGVQRDHFYKTLNTAVCTQWIFGE